MRFLLTYAPADGERQQWEFDPDNISSIEAELLEEAGGGAWETYNEWIELADRGSTRAYRALLWMFLQRTNPGLEFDAVVYRRRELTGELIEDEPVGKDEPDAENTDSP